MNDKAGVSGRLTLRLRGPDGRVKQLVRQNTVTQQGLAGIADQLLDSPTAGKPTHLAVGTGLPTGDGLGSEIGRVPLQQKTRDDTTVTMTTEFAEGQGIGYLTEAGLYDRSSGGTMWCSATLGGMIPKKQADTLEISWELTIA
jgi:hypothetical protein